MKKLFCAILAMLMLLSLAACGNKGPKDLNLADTYTAITKNVQMPEMMQVGNELLLDLYGIREEYYTQAVVYMCVNSLRADEIWLIEAKDADSLARLKELAQARLDEKDTQSIVYSPEQNEVVKKAQIIEAGNYLVMICSPDVETIAAAFRTEAGI